jgi:L-iditol 2-dehydrogenase
MKQKEAAAVMKAAVLHGQKDLRYEEIERPKAGEGEVVVRVRATGICGSDIPRVLGRAAHYYPIVLGHEFSGTVAEVGPGVTGLQEGQRVTAAPLCPCLQCADCQRGNYSLCKHYKFIGSSVYGSFADFVKVPARNIVPFSEEVDFVRAAFFEPSTVGLHGLFCAGYQGGEHVAILGGGTIGLFTMLWARLLGAKSVSVFDISDARLSLAKKMGADRVYNTAREDFLEEALAETGGEGFPFVFETAGQNATMSLAFDAAANRASVCFIGTSSRDLQFPWKQFEKMNRKEFRLTGSWMSYSAPFPGREWQMTAEYLGSGRLTLDDALVWKKFPMSEAAKAFSLYETPGAVGGKIMLVNEE